MTGRKADTPASWAERYEEQARTQRATVRDLQCIEEMLATLNNGFSLLLDDDHFRALLRAEGLDRIPTFLLKAHAVEEIPLHKSLNECSNGAGSEVEALLLPRTLCPKARAELARMHPTRQIEAARLMIASGCFSAAYIRALVCATAYPLLACPKARPKMWINVARRNAASEEITVLAERLKNLNCIQASDLIGLLVVCRYVSKLLMNQRIDKLLRTNWPDVLRDLSGTVEAYRNCELIQFGSCRRR